jgi:hypothetical protein
VADFDKTGLSSDEIREIRRTRRREFRKALPDEEAVALRRKRRARDTDVEVERIKPPKRGQGLTRETIDYLENVRSQQIAYVTDFDPTGLSQEEIKEIHRTRRREFREQLFETMAEEDVEEYKSLREAHRQEFMSEEALAEREERIQKTLSARKEAAALSQRQREQMDALNARKKQLASKAGIQKKERPESFRNIDPRRSRTLRTVVKPEFQKPRHVDTMVSEMRAQNPTKVTQSMMAQASRLAQTPVTGKTFFPPQNANPTIVHPWTARFSPPSKPLPSYMNWADTANIAAVRGWRLPRSRLSRARRVSTDTKGYLHEVVDQLGCGSCWSVSVAGAMSDRVSIWSQEENPQLSITNILGCVSGDGSEGEMVTGASMYSPATAGCAGGIPTGAVEMLAKFGDASAGCVGYEWCENDPVCNQSRRLGFSDSPEYLNSIIPACADMLKTCLECKNGECEAGSKSRTVWGLETYPSGRPYILLTDPLSIQQELAANGPVVATYAIYGDFQNGTAAVLGDGWAKTNGVYCNVQTQGKKPYSGTRYAGSERQMIGYHAVVIVGWGLEQGVPDWENPGSTFDIPYWIVRNSWGTQWNEDCMVNGNKMPGYCKIAITDRARNINTKVYLDTADDGLIGAALSFRPKVLRVEPPRDKEPQVDTDPEMHEDKIEPGAADVKLAGLVRDEDVSDASELERDYINHPILCSDETPHTVRKVNCRLGVSEKTSSCVKWIPFVVVGVVTLLIVVLLGLRVKRK